MQDKTHDQLNPRSPTQTSHHSRVHSNATTTNSAVGNQSPYGNLYSNFNEEWTAHQQRLYNAQLLLYQSQQHQHQHQHSGLSVHRYNDTQEPSSSYHNVYSHQQDHNRLHYQSNSYFGSGSNSNAEASSSLSSQQPHYQQVQSASNRQAQTIKSPRQQFTDTLKRGVQNIAFTPAGGSHHEARRSVNQVATLPARPDSAIRAAQANQGVDLEATIQPMPFIHSQSNKVGTMPSSMNNASMTAPPRPAPSLPLSSRFPPLPPKPTLTENYDPEQLQKNFEAREEALLLRVDALGFQPEAAWQVMREAVNGQKLSESDNVDQDHRETTAPILGIRLLQRLELMQKENKELEVIFSERVDKGKDESELQDAHRLIDALDEALTKATKRAEQAEAKVSGLEKALAIACDQRSSAITSTSSGRIQSPNAPPSWQRSSPTSSRSYQ